VLVVGPRASACHSVDRDTKSLRFGGDLVTADSKLEPSAVVETNGTRNAG
jgi:hypothetical protein